MAAYEGFLSGLQAQADQAFQQYQQALEAAGCLPSPGGPFQFVQIDSISGNPRAAQAALQLEADARGITLTELQAERAVARAAARQAAKATGKAVGKNHLLPKQFAGQFKKAGLDIERYVIEMERGAHRLKPDGIHTGRQSWNRVWENFFKAKENRSKDEILEQLIRMIKDFGLDK